MAGYDTSYAKDLADSEILDMARREKRVLLTRDVQLAERAGEGGLLINTPVLEGQMRQVVSTFHLDMERPLTRCTLCNGPLITVGPEEVEGKVPERVRSTNREFYVCQQCGQVYWKGSHWQRINKKLDEFKACNNPR
jgi:uncharacterized protein with PIN domain